MLIQSYRRYEIIVSVDGVRIYNPQFDHVVTVATVKVARVYIDRMIRYAKKQRLAATIER